MNNFDFVIEPLRHNVSVINMKFPWSRDEIVSELEKEDWRPFGMDTSVPHDRWPGKRYKVLNPKSHLLNTIRDFLQSGDIHRYMIEKLYENHQSLQVTWQMYPWRAIQNTSLHVEFTKDMPGFENGIHLDTRMLFGTGMIYLTEHDDERWASGFYNDLHKNNPVTIPSGFGQGWIHANDYDTWHDGWNRTDQIRYSMLFALTLRLENQPMPSDRIPTDATQ